MGVLADYGLRSIRTVTDATLNGYSRAGADLSIVANCNGTEGLVHGGAFSTLGSNGTGIPVTGLDGSTCGALVGGAGIASAAFVLTSASPDVYLLTGGTPRRVESWGDVLNLNNGSAPVISTLSVGTVQGLPQQGGVVAPYSLVKSSQDATIWMTDGLDRKQRLDSFATSSALGLGSWRVVSDQVLNAYNTTGTTSRVVTCAGLQYIGLGGVLYPMSAGNPHGLAVSELGGSCGVLNRSGAAPFERVFLKSNNSAVVYHLSGGQRRSVNSWADLVALNGGSAPQVFTVTPSEVSALPDGGRL